MSIRNLFIALTVVFLTACGNAPEAPVETAAPEAPAAQVESAAAEIEAAAEETAAEAPVAAAAPQEWKYREGAHYQRFANAQGTSSSPDKIEVAEVFWYGCPHCYSFEPYLEKWKKTLPADVAFVKIPVMWNPTNEVHARLFYTIQALGLEDAHSAVFSEMHTKRKMLASEGAQRDFIVSNFDVSEDEFNKAYRSFSVNGKIQQAKTLTTRYQVRSVPILIINGKYATTGDELRDFDMILDVAEELVARERAGL